MKDFYVTATTTDTCSAEGSSTDDSAAATPPPRAQGGFPPEGSQGMPAVQGRRKIRSPGIVALPAARLSSACRCLRAAMVTTETDTSTTTTAVPVRDPDAFNSSILTKEQTVTESFTTIADDPVLVYATILATQTMMVTSCLATSSAVSTM